MPRKQSDDTDRESVPQTKDDFALYVQKQASTMAQGGWTKEATDLRKWVSELRGKTPPLPFHL
jgi:hypothetical protein